MKQISLTQGKYTLVNDADFDWLNQWKWCANEKAGDFYAVRNSRRGEGKKRTIFMHRQILGLEYKNKQEGDHRNHNTLDNRRTNIRICTRKENAMNRGANCNSTSQFKGVCWVKKVKKWEAKIEINKITKHLGYFLNEIFAANIYDQAAKKYFGEFAYLNFN